MASLKLILGISVLVSLIMQFYVLAETSGEKATGFAHDMNSAMDCAVRGVDITVCAPNITNISFDDEAHEFLRLIDEVKVIEKGVANFVAGADIELIEVVGDDIVIEVEGELIGVGVGDSVAIGNSDFVVTSANDTHVELIIDH